MTLTVDQLKLRPGIVGTSIDDAVLTSYLAAAYEAIAQRVGASGNVSTWVRRPRGALLLLPEPASAIVSVTEGTTDLETDDYELRGQTVKRLATGTNPALWWCADVDITWTPLEDDDERDRVAADLVRLELAFTPGLISQQIGDWRETFADPGQGSYEEQREAILASLGGSSAGIR